MAEYWCDPSGNDGAAGDQAHPWETPQKAADTAGAGDTVHFNDGTYELTASVDFDTNSGGAGTEITFEAVNYGSAIWNCTGAIRPIDCDQDYLIFRGLVFDGDTTANLGAFCVFTSSNYIYFYDCEFRNTSGHRIRISGGGNFTIHRCLFHAETHWEDYTPNRSQDDVYIYGNADGVTITDCEMYHSNHVGIAIVNADNITVQRCEIHDQTSHAFQVGDNDNVGTSDTILIERCRMYENGSWRTAGKENKVGVFCEYGCSNVTVRFNMIYKNDGPGIHVRGDATGPLSFYNNTLYSNLEEQVNDWGDILFADEGGGTPTINLKNNLIYHNKNGTSKHTLIIENGIEGVGNIDADYNLYYDSTGEQEIDRDGNSYATYAAYQAAGYEPNSISGDPDFEGAESGIFELQPGSPAINAGVDVGLPYYSTAPDIGARETWPNLLAIVDHTNTRFLFQKSGSALARVEWTTFEKHDDLALLAVLEAVMLGLSEEAI